MRDAFRMVAVLRSALSTRRDLLLEILALRHQLGVVVSNNSIDTLRPAFRSLLRGAALERVVHAASIGATRSSPLGSDPANHVTMCESRFTNLSARQLSIILFAMVALGGCGVLAWSGFSCFATPSASLARP